MNGDFGTNPVGGSAPSLREYNKETMRQQAAMAAGSPIGSSGVMAFYSKKKVKPLSRKKCKVTRTHKIHSPL